MYTWDKKEDDAIKIWPTTADYKVILKPGSWGKILALNTMCMLMLVRENFHEMLAEQKFAFFYSQKGACLYTYDGKCL